MDRDVAPESGFVVSCGDLSWIEADETRGAVPSAPHPHVVVQEDVFSQSRIGTVVVCALSSNLRRASAPGNALREPGQADPAS
ncbi:type II toxin-antitoxin system PemK/MazF family toxin [Luteimonas rhizosphaericola]|uniref:type II toxin-antitoxin system PemK/MazF family toxin n=1 Tax=Luteimonas rhizosphaericola TaxID=3042024 RepID=UPI003CE4E649